MYFFLGLVHVQCTFQTSLRGKSAWIMIMNDGAVSWIIFSIQIPLFFPKHTKRPTLTHCLPQPNTTSIWRPFSMTRVRLFKQLERPDFWWFYLSEDIHIRPGSLIDLTQDLQCIYTSLLGKGLNLRKIKNPSHLLKEHSYTVTFIYLLRKCVQYMYIYSSV